MRKISWLIKKEAKTLKKLLILITIIITIFTMALLSLINVRIDLSKNFLASLNKDIDGLPCDVNDIKVEKLRSLLNNDTILYARLKHYTELAELYSCANLVFKTEQVTDIDGNINIFTYNGQIIYNYENLKKVLDTQNNKLLSGRWIDNQDEIVLSSFISEQLKVNIGETIQIKDKKFVIVGVFDYEKLTLSDLEYYRAYYFLSLSDEVTVDKLTIIMPQSSDTYNLYNKLKLKGFDTEISGLYLSYFESIESMQIFLLTIIIIIFIAIIIIVYSFLSMVLMQRKKYICQLKLLGCSEKNILLTYVLIAISMAFIATIIGCFLAFYFNQYIMDLCSSLFNVTMITSVNVFIPIIFFAIIAVIIFTLYFIINAKIKSKIIAQAIKEK